MNQRFIYLLVFVLSTIRLWSQEEKPFDPINTPIETALPTLAQLFDSAAMYSPLLKIKDSQIVISKLQEVSTRRKWMQFASLQGKMSWGLFDSFVTDVGTTSSTLTTSNQTRYSTGLTIRIPIYDLFTLGINNKIAREKADVAQFEYESTMRQIRELIIKQYNDLVLAQSLLILKNENAESIDLMRVMGEKQFANGTITLSDLTSVRQASFKAKEEFAKAKNAFILTYLLLQESTGIEFKLL